MRLSYKKTKHIPGGMPSEQVQGSFIKEILSLVEKASISNGKLVVLSCDPTHPVHNSIPGYLWQERGKENTQTLKANTGRRRLTVVGAINLSDRDIVPLVTESNADRYLIEAFFLEVKKAYPNAREIVIILDNAAYQRSYEVQEYAKELGITLKYLPPYTPNLSLIERVWKFFKKEVLRDYYHDTFEKFFDAVCAFFERWDEYEEQLKSLLTLNFEIMKARN